MEKKKIMAALLGGALTMMSLVAFAEEPATTAVVEKAEPAATAVVEKTEPAEKAEAEKAEPAATAAVEKAEPADNAEKWSQQFRRSGRKPRCVPQLRVMKPERSTN